MKLFELKIAESFRLLFRHKLFEAWTEHFLKLVLERDLIGERAGGVDGTTVHLGQINSAYVFSMLELTALVLEIIRLHERRIYDAALTRRRAGSHALLALDESFLIMPLKDFLVERARVRIEFAHFDLFAYVFDFVYDCVLHARLKANRTFQARSTKRGHFIRRVLLNRVFCARWFGHVYYAALLI